MSLYNFAQRMAICVGRDFIALTYQTVTNFSKCTKVKITSSPRLTYIACCAFVLYLCSRFIALINLIDETVIIVNPSPIPKFINTNVNKSIWNK